MKFSFQIFYLIIISILINSIVNNNTTMRSLFSKPQPGTAAANIPAKPQGNYNKATFGGGCFWGVDKLFRNQFQDKLASCSVGYMGGNLDNPSYRDVCTGKTNHAEVVHLEFKPEQVPYEDLVEFFWRIHDPTTPNRQGNDMGTQYRSVIFYHNEEQKKIAEEMKPKIEKHFNNPVVTEIVPASKFYLGEDYHQKYLFNNPGGYCNHKLQW
eukprot:gb/GECH01012104.1/.p1 GENE.gb/GECH01012104.1/~~gb/GECH01012104.1/.p1  ORF type:complete len:211 (+),score=41.44 gb/GECH01012104.1/:1-633(+)